MPDAVLVGVDVGTTSCKVTVCTADGREVANGKAPLEWQVTRDGVEVEPATILRAVGPAIAVALAQAPACPVAAVGVASMGESGVLLDRRGDPVAPVIAWHDDRDRALVERLADDLGADTFAGATGLPILPQWSLTKHRWLVDHRAEAERAVRRLGIAEWVVRALGGEEASELSLASRTGWLQVDSGRWWPSALEWSGVRETLLPPLVQAGTPLGRVTADWAGERLVGAVLTVAGHDHLAAALGAGAAGDGDQLDSCGTAEALVRTVPAPISSDAVLRLVAAGVTVGRHVLPGRLALLGDTRGGLLLQNVQRMLGFSSSELAAIDAEALRHGAGTVSAELTSDGTVVLAGIGRDATPGRAWFAALESAASRVVRMDTNMTAVLGPHRRVIMTGGWARSAAVRELRRNAWGEVGVAAVGEAGGRGAALLAGWAAGLVASPTEVSSGPSFDQVQSSREADQILLDGRAGQNQTRRQQASHKTNR
ncbi:MAG: xylulose kinase [Actinomycetia bacterium]|nr:xylulose kinase [Actinomycetes bacterium]